MSFMIPVKRLRETSSLLAFYHPTPSYPFHVLLVPKHLFRSLMEVPLEGIVFQRELFTVVQSLVHEFGLESTGYRLIANGGAYQDAPILHFHLISDKAPEKGDA